ncbi:MAG TPA: dTMP kinase [Candidatus Omnitrophica bacterium]|nr:MAG: dTMP kinase [Omnitrophica WOR_2 bacterium GWA2_63_20]OGX18663.1 MAG: dTMP kinase [Omnitrophica WOR_2 bacterium GWF2_63_9]OGX32274.1 MAG: dTMP kinase [Omnitrophica WOR_2 bacterium RIFCSPHIGHO2_12_FULL_64_13]OGX35400.1 MAG: dTMP kinase [Omnitrophica WOR_2 bacterium RIFCSPHIGHO2_02_FULL_63_39]OGX45432.1 MAG: dTMP kinase [Omnitrophica WOR_2 bacterium RIFCSPLOWO2_02_FULL_63_16]OGX47617.1 MAG: dTMP kinase [Omnitrophica WOR_2 bacterium RIFCSPLOWO2_12_FULL_63_16]HBH96763.1 dTMP kinase [Candid
MSRAFFITLEGPEGSGKSSQAKRLVATLRRTGRRVVSLHDPGTTAVGRRLRRVLLRERLALSPLVEALLFIAGRVQLVEERIRPALAQGAVIVCDRYYDSTMAYQGYGGGLPIAWLDRLGRHAIGCVRPDLTFVLDLSPEAGLRRVKGAKDRMERKALAFHRRVRRGFLTIAAREPRRCVVLDATQPPSQIHRHIANAVLARLAAHSR